PGKPRRGDGPSRARRDLVPRSREEEEQRPRQEDQREHRGVEPERGELAVARLLEAAEVLVDDEGAQPAGGRSLAERVPRRRDSDRDRPRDGGERDAEESAPRRAAGTPRDRDDRGRNRGEGALREEAEADAQAEACARPPPVDRECAPAE